MIEINNTNPMSHVEESKEIFPIFEVQTTKLTIIKNDVVHIHNT
jgi:hypothetical protein